MVETPFGAVTQQQRCRRTRPPDTLAARHPTTGGLPSPMYLLLLAACSPPDVAPWTGRWLGSVDWSTDTARNIQEIYLEISETDDPDLPVHGTGWLAAGHYMDAITCDGPVGGDAGHRHAVLACDTGIESQLLLRLIEPSHDATGHMEGLTGSRPDGSTDLSYDALYALADGWGTVLLDTAVDGVTPVTAETSSLIETATIACEPETFLVAMSLRADVAPEVTGGLLEIGSSDDADYANTVLSWVVLTPDADGGLSWTGEVAPYHTSCEPVTSALLVATGLQYEHAERLPL